ncbi:sodium pump decarboxylase subunit gamma [Acidaminobacter sp. JC074]|uniref:OadG family protein n=1 Tax=Acidaminobacter sp. JC074 TaxID=2530199 RepID=UPI001F0F37B1|nr:OadG family protein [Acidaminobacter sp. JC074]MCH4890720.1 sodium pump decarboxylase subunit gamma [Acidaminobacter sp. JC074]
MKLYMMNLALASRGINDILELLKADPEAIHTLTSNEKTTMVLFVTALGMAITFAVLLFLWFSINVLSKVMKAFTKENKKPAPVQKVETKAVETVKEEEEDEELIAVIAAAVAASLNTSIHNIVVKNVVRVGDHSPSWAKTGRIEQMNTRF